MALKNDKEKRICAKYSARDVEGFVHCDECPLIVNDERPVPYCKAVAHYDTRLKEWILDENYITKVKRKKENGEC